MNGMRGSAVFVEIEVLSCCYFFPRFFVVYASDFNNFFLPRFFVVFVDEIEVFGKILVRTVIFACQ